MQESSDRVIVINLMDLLFHLLYRWRSILLVTLAATVLFGGYRFITKRQEQREQEAILADPMTVEGSSSKLSIVTAKQKMQADLTALEELERYGEESIWLHLDPENYIVGTIQFFVQVDDEASENGIRQNTEDMALYAANIYTSALLQNMDAAERKAVFGTETLLYVDELASVDYNKITRSIVVQVVGDDEETVKAQLHYLSDRMEVIKVTAEKMVRHSLLPITEIYNLQRNPDLVTQQQEQAKKLIAARQTYMDSKGAYEGMQPGGVAKYAVIGLLVGFVLSVGWFAITYVLDGKVHERVAMKTWMGKVPLLGELYSSRAKSLGKGVDGLIERWERIWLGIPDDVTAYRILCNLLSERYANQNVVLTGTLSEETMQALYTALEPCRQAGVVLSVQPDFLHTEQAIATTGKADVILLVEKKHVSVLRDIGKVKDIITLGKAKLEGYILL